MEAAIIPTPSRCSFRRAGPARGAPACQQATPNMKIAARPAGMTAFRNFVIKGAPEPAIRFKIAISATAAKQAIT